MVVADGARIKRHQAPGVALLFSYVAPTKIYGQGWRSFLMLIPDIMVIFSPNIGPIFVW